MAERAASAFSASPHLPLTNAGASPAASCTDSEFFRGLPCLHLRLPCGDAVRVALHGAQVLSWESGGRERLYLSPKAVFDGHSAVRGGVPVCFPQFNQRGPLPKHGFVRNLVWTAVAENGVAPQVKQAAPPVPGDSAQVSLDFRDTEPTRAMWPQAFEATLTVQLDPGSLKVTLAARNTDVKPLFFTGALHTYLAVDDIAAVRLDGLQGQPCWNALDGQTEYAREGIRFTAEFDRVFSAAPNPLTLTDGENRLGIAQSASLADTVVWNPGALLCSQLADMPPDGFARMLCVEAAQVMSPVEVAPGDAWQGWQRLSVL